MKSLVSLSKNVSTFLSLHLSSKSSYTQTKQFQYKQSDFWGWPKLYDLQQVLKWLQMYEDRVTDVFQHWIRKTNASEHQRISH